MTQPLGACIINEEAQSDISFKINSSYKDRVIAEGTIQRADSKNRNRRMYKRKDLNAEIHGSRLQELVTSGNLKGEAGHPSSTELARQQKIDPTLEQVLYIRLWMEGDLVKAHFCGTNNELGNTFDKDLRMGQRPSFSLRALGSITNENGNAYVTNLKIITYDRVYFPSHPEAYTTKIISENADLFESEFLFKTQDIIKESGNTFIERPGFSIVTPITQHTISNYIQEESVNIKTILNNFDCIRNTMLLSEDATKVTMIDAYGTKFIIPIEKHIQNEIMEACNKFI